MLPPGHRIEHYEIIERLGAGGMGEVYRARDSRLDREVAIKVLRIDRPAGEDAVARFAREARAASALNHPNIVHVYDVGSVDLPDQSGRSFRTSYIAMELVRGSTLRQLWRVGTQPEQLLDWFIQIASALGKAHAAGIVHRDLKPENLMVNEDGWAKVLDFGLAKLEQPDDGVTPVEGDSPTAPVLGSTGGLMLGTPPYMAPEQVAGRSADARSDVFALGTMLFEGIVGQRPFPGETVVEVLHRIAYGPPPTLPQTVPRDLRAVILRCLDRDPTGRFASGEALAQELRRIRAGAPVETRSSAGGGRRLALVSTLVAIAAAAIVLAWATRDRGATPPPSRSGRAIGSVAVLPFENRSGDPELEYLCDGMTDQIIFTLSRLESPRVMSRASVFGFKGKAVTPGEAGRALGVDAVLSGQVVQGRPPDGLEIRIELAGSDGTSLWGQRYDLDPATTLVIQDRITREVVANLRRALSPGESQRIAEQPTRDPEAYRDYLKGRFAWNKRTAEGLQGAIEHFDAALARDPEFALAWAGLGDAHALREQYAGIPSKENCPRALAAVRKAIELDPNLAAPHASMGLLTAHCEWDWAESEKEFRRAIEIDPRYPTSHHWYALHLGYRLRFDEALAEARRAEDLDPLSPIVGNAISVVFDYARRWDEAIAQSQRVLDLSPDFAVAHQLRGRARCGKGEFDGALADLRHADALAGGASPETAGFLGVACARRGDRGRALEQISALERGLGSNPAQAYPIAKIHAVLGDREEALGWLDRARDEHSWHLVELQVDPAFDSIRADPRFQELVETIGFDAPPGE